MPNAKSTDSLSGLVQKLNELRHENKRLRAELDDLRAALKAPRYRHQPNRRTWTLDEIREIRRLRDEEGLPYLEIGERIGVPDANKIRCVYSVGRTQDRTDPTVQDLWTQHGVPRHIIADLRRALKNAGKPSSNADVLAAYKGET